MIFFLTLKQHCVYLLSHVQLFVIPWTVALQAPLSMEFSRQEYCSELLCPPPGDLPKPGIEPGSLTLQADSLPSESPGKPPSYSNTMIVNISVPFFQSIPMKYYNSTI